VVVRTIVPAVTPEEARAAEEDTVDEGVKEEALAGVATPATTKPAARRVAPSALKSFVIQIF
jgi:hypothetical protein